MKKLRLGKIFIVPSNFQTNLSTPYRQLEKDIRAKMAERNDYQAYYYRPAIAKYHRISKEAADYLESIQGD